MAFTFGKSHRRFTTAGQAVEVFSISTSKGFTSRLLLDGVEVATDSTPPSGDEALRNHRLAATLADGSPLEVEAGYVGWWSIGSTARVAGQLIYESHPGKVVAYPEALRRFADQSDFDSTRQKASLVPLAVDIVMGIVFFIVARATDLTTAAVVGAVLGAALLVAQRFVKVDLVGGLALFGVVMLLISAGFALLFNTGLAVQLRTVVLGLLSAAFFLVDGWRGGPWLGRGLALYLPYRDLDTGAVAIGMGLLGAAMAAINVLFIWLASEDVWLFYTTFLDIPLIIVGFFLVTQRARRRRPA
jgi:intracellular septation protein A